MEKITGLESLLLCNSNFDVWCEDLSIQILNDNFISKDNLKENIKSKIILNENYFYQCLCNEIESKIQEVKKTSQIHFKKNNKKEYIESGFVLSELNIRLKKYNIERTKAFQSNQYKRFKDYLREQGYDEIIKEFNELKNG